MTEFRSRTVAGISWSVASQIGRHGTLAITTVILANLLSPREFGLLAMITIITRFAEVLTELGFGSALVQKKQIYPIHLSSVFWVNLATGFVITGSLILAAPLVGEFYGEPILVSLTMFVALTFLVGSAGIVPQTLFTRDIDFRTIAIVETWAAVIAGVAAIGMAVGGFGVWALASQEVIRATATTVLFWGYTDWRPSFRISGSAITELTRFSLNLLGNRTLNYWSRQVDDLLIGRYIGSDALGSYRMAYDIMLFPLRNVSRVISRVMFPSLSEIQDQEQKVKDIFLRVTRAIGLITFPLMLGLLATTEPFVLTVFGEDWRSMVPILRVLSLVGLVQSIGTLNGNLFMSQGRTDLQFRLGAAVKSFRILAIVIGLWWGVLGVTIAYGASVWLTAYPTFAYAGGLVDMTVGELLRNLSGVFSTAALMALLVFGMGFLLPEDWPEWGRLATQVPTGILLYTGLIVLFDLETYRDVWALVTDEVSLR